MEIRFSFREWSYASSLYDSFFDHLKCWSFGIWIKENMCGVWEDSGIRFMGIEINIRKYLRGAR